MGEPAYRVEVDEGGCEHCLGGRTWTVVGPFEDVAIGQSFSRQEDAEDLCEYMNLAFDHGVTATIKKAADLSKPTTIHSGRRAHVP